MHRKNWLGLVAVVALVVSLVSTVAKAGVTEWEAGASQGDIRMEARYMENFENDLVDQSLELRLQNASRNTVFTVAINGRAIGRFTTDGNGDGSFVLEKLGGEADGNGRPVGPRINTGDIISVTHGIHTGEAVFVPA